jgi:hypothetical protein
VAVEKGTKAVISANFSAYDERTFKLTSELQLLRHPEKSFSTPTPDYTNNPNCKRVLPQAAREALTRSALPPARWF